MSILFRKPIKGQENLKVLTDNEIRAKVNNEARNYAHYMKQFIKQHPDQGFTKSFTPRFDWNLPSTQYIQAGLARGFIDPKSFGEDLAMYRKDPKNFAKCWGDKCMNYLNTDDEEVKNHWRKRYSTVDKSKATKPTIPDRWTPKGITVLDQR